MRRHRGTQRNRRPVTRPARYPPNPDGDTLPSHEHLFDTGWVDPGAPAPPWEAGRQTILNDTGARVPEHTFNQPVPIVARIVWANDGEEHVETEALGWTGRDVYVRMPDRRYNRTAVWLDAADVRRR